MQFYNKQKIIINIYINQYYQKKIVINNKK